MLQQQENYGKKWVHKIIQFNPYVFMVYLNIMRRLWDVYYTEIFDFDLLPDMEIK